MFRETQHLRCPNCGNTATFHIASTVWLGVGGADALEPLSKSEDRVYGSDNAFRCDACWHQEAMGAFYGEDE